MIELLDTVRVSHSQEGAVLLDVSKGKIYGLNPVASRIVSLLERGLNREQIHAEISREFTRDLASVRRDVDGFLAQLAHHRLIRGNDGTQANDKP